MVEKVKKKVVIHYLTALHIEKPTSGGIETNSWLNLNCESPTLSKK